MSETFHNSVDSEQRQGILMPAPTAWPLVLAVGTSLIFAGLLTNVSVSVLGCIVALFGAVGWFREVLPHEHEELVQVQPEVSRASQPSRKVKRLAVQTEIHRAWLPLKIYPVSAGVKGGLAGGIAMAVFAGAYGIISQGSVWYPINLLAGSLYSASSTPSVEAMRHFNAGWFAFATAMHITMCLLVGLLYGAMLPLLPRRPIVLGGIIGPLIWTGLLYHVIGYVNPLLDQRINWWWFALSQAAFGVVAGVGVSRQSKVWTEENLPLAIRAGIEAPGLTGEPPDEDGQ